MTQRVTLHYPGAVVRLRTPEAQALDIVDAVHRAWGDDDAPIAFTTSSHERSGITRVWHLRADDVIGVEIEDDDVEPPEEFGFVREDGNQWVGLLGLTWQLFQASLPLPSRRFWFGKFGRSR
jgi:hypothetical protein